jgi:hypothetical protein
MSCGEAGRPRSMCGSSEHSDLARRREFVVLVRDSELATKSAVAAGPFTGRT